MKPVSNDKKKLAPKVMASAASGIVDMIKNYGGDVESILGNSGISTSAIISPAYELDLVKYCDLFDVSAKLTNNYYFGLSFGSSFKPSKLGAIGYLIVNSPTLSAALNNLVSYFPAHQDNSIVSLTQNRGLYQLNYEITDPRVLNRRQDAEVSIGMFCNIFKHCLGDRWTPIEIHFSHHKIDENIAIYEKVFGCPVLFNQSTNSILFRHSEFNAIMPNNDPFLFAVLEPDLSKRRHARSSPDDLFMEIKHFVKTNLGESVPTLASTAKNFCLSSTDFQRELKNKGFSFNDILKITRKELALKYIGETDMKLTEVAFALGYSELSAFSRAFKYWTNMSPQQYRQLSLQDIEQLPSQLNATNL